MLNQTGIKKTVGAAPVQILFNVQNQLSVPIIVDDGNYVSENGRKIVKAGTPLTGSLTARGTAFTKAATEAAVIGETEEITISTSAETFEVSVDKSNAVGILLHDVDVTDGDANGTLLIWGFVDMTKLDSTTAALITDEVKEALKGNVTFLQ